MRTLGQLSGAASSWLSATGNPVEERWFSFPFLGTPWEHQCASLRSKQVSISVIIPFWNSAVTLEQCLTSIRLSSLSRLAPGRVEVILADDGSTDKSWEIAKRVAYGMDIKAYSLAHRSQSAALNFALERASGDVVVLCDSDMVLGCGALDELAARHEQWTDVMCFGFRSNIESENAYTSTNDIWRLMHREAFSNDNRVSFDLPTIEPNMLVATQWLSFLKDGNAIIDTQGSVWRRHRFVFGCLFSIRREALRQCGLFPDSLEGWGFGDTLVAARFEANGGFLLPVTSAWGHHVHHDIRHPLQWFQGSRNQLAYEYLLSHPVSNELWRSNYSSQLSDSFTVEFNSVSSKSEFDSQSVDWSPVTMARLGWWSECLSVIKDDSKLKSECLFRLGKYEDVIKTESSLETIWGVLSLHRCGSTEQAVHALSQAAASDSVCTYAFTASIPELRRLAENYWSIGMSSVAENYNDLAAIIAATR